MGITSATANSFSNKNHIPYKSIILFCDKYNLKFKKIFFKKLPLTCTKCDVLITDENRSVSIDRRSNPPVKRSRGECKACRCDYQKIRSKAQYAETKKQVGIAKALNKQIAKAKREKNKEILEQKKVELAKQRIINKEAKRKNAEEIAERKRIRLAKKEAKNKPTKPKKVESIKKPVVEKPVTKKVVKIKEVQKLSKMQQIFKEQNDRKAKAKLMSNDERLLEEYHNKRKAS